MVVRPNATLYGTECFIVCTSEEEAKDLTNKLNQGSLKRPTEDPTGYEIIQEYAALEGRHFWRKK